MSEKIHPATGLPETDIVSVPFSSELIQVNVELLNAAVKGIGIQSVRAVTALVDTFERAVAAHKNLKEAQKIPNIAGSVGVNAHDLTTH